MLSVWKLKVTCVQGSECMEFNHLFFVINEGMMHLMDHENVNEGLLQLMDTEGLDVQLSYDGLRVPINL